MRRTKLASRYAKAFFEFAQEYNQVERISKDFLLINKVFQENKNLQTVINSPIVRVDKKINIIREVFQQHIIDITLKYLLLILRKGRELHLDIICDEYVKLYKKYKNIITLDVYSASELDNNSIDIIKNKVANHTNAEIEIIKHVRPKLIGGVLFKFNDYYYDASIRKQLDRIKKERIDTTYQPNF